MALFVTEDSGIDSAVDLFDNAETSNTPVRQNSPVESANTRSGYSIDLSNVVSSICNVNSINYMSLEKRLLTFSLFESRVMPKLQLAEAGFMSLGNMDAVVCPWCKLELHNFEHRVDAMAIHQMHGYQHCPYLIAVEQSNELPANGDSEGRSQAGELPLPTTRLMEPIGLRVEHPELGAGEELSDTRKYNKFLILREQTELDNLSRVNPPQAVDDMRDERCRQLSFTRSGLVETEASKQLASRGLFLKCESSTQRISCNFCDFNILIGSRVSLHVANIISKHSKNPDGGFCQRVGNIPDVFNKYLWNDLEEDARNLCIITDRAKYPEFAVSDRRSATFLTYPHRSAKHPNELHEAGLFYEGNGESVTCFSCGVVFPSWLTNEKVWHRHARSSRNCLFVRMKMGRDFANGIIEQCGLYTPPQEENRINNVTTRMLRPRMDSIVAQGALEMGYDRTQVRRVIANRKKKGEADFRYIADIVRAVETLLFPEQPISVAALHTILPIATRPDQLQDSENGVEDLEDEMVWHRWDSPDVQNSLLSVLGEEKMRILADRHAEEGAPSNVTLAYILRLVLPAEWNEICEAGDVEDTVAETPENYRTISSQLCCKICLVDIIGIIFLPCGHFVCCTTCAPAMTKCPLCRKDISGTIRANI